MLDLVKFRRADQFARERHEGQRYGNRPFVGHLEDVVLNLRRFGHGEDTELLVAGVLHDVIEDTPTTLEEVRRQFGEEVATLVDLLTEKGGNRRERHASTYPRIAGNARATTLKLADRLANVWACHMGNGKKGLFEMYKKEFTEFQQLLYRPGDGNEKMWIELRILMSGDPMAEAG